MNTTQLLNNLCPFEVRSGMPRLGRDDQGMSIFFVRIPALSSVEQIAQLFKRAVIEQGPVQFIREEGTSAFYQVTKFFTRYEVLANDLEDQVYACMLVGKKIQ